jgi:DNA-binding transcriptional MerR regulator
VANAAATGDGDDDEGLLVDELSEQSGVSVRTIRFYQSKGLLEAPGRRGRHARYSRDHVDRLALIAELHERGLRLSAIQELLTHAWQGTDATDWLGLEKVMRRPWTDDHPALLTEAELDARLAGCPAGSAAALERTGIVERRADTTPVVYLVPSPGMLEVSVESLRLGLDLDTAARLRDLLVVRLRAMATELVATFTEEVSRQQLAVGGPAQLADLLDRVQPLARRTVELVFAHEMERAQRDLLDEPSP